MEFESDGPLPDVWTRSALDSGVVVVVDILDAALDGDPVAACRSATAEERAFVGLVSVEGAGQR